MTETPVPAAAVDEVAAWNTERERLSAEVDKAILALLAHTGAAGFYYDIQTPIGKAHVKVSMS